MISMKDTSPEDIKKTLLKHDTDVSRQRWAKKDDIGELKKSGLKPI